MREYLHRTYWSCTVGTLESFSQYFYDQCSININNNLKKTLAWRLYTIIRVFFQCYGLKSLRDIWLGMQNSALWLVSETAWLCVCVCVCVWVRERERERGLVNRDLVLLNVFSHTPSPKAQ